LIPHTVLTITPLLPSTTATGTGIGIFNAGVVLFYNFVEAAAMLDQPVPVWPGPGAASPPQLVGASLFPPGSNVPVLISDATGAGIAAQATTSAGQTMLSISGLPATPLNLQSPLSVMFNLLDFTRGKTVTNEVLGSGDPTAPNQTFKLAKSPLTYLRPGATLVSTLAITVNGQAWSEVPFLFGQGPAARVFVTAQDADQITTVMFGDGVNGARLPAGRNNIIANYRFGSGSASPPAGTLTVIANPYPGLRALRNPVAAGGGADPDPPGQIAAYAPRSVLTFGRAVSALDFEAIAAQVAGGTRVGALWGWDSVDQRGGVTVYVADDGAVLADVRNAMAGAGDPNRPVTVLSATPIEAALIIEFIVTPAADASAVQTAITTALTDPVAGLFGAQKLGIGQSVFNSQIAAACQAVPGFVAIEVLIFLRADMGFEDAALHQVPEGAYFDLPSANVWLIPQAAANG
jgi:predicted phage baseplate assembly protein